MKIPISVLNYNGSKDTIELIKTLVKSGEYFDCIIVDNDSSRTDDLDIIAAFIKNNYKTELCPEDFVLDTISSVILLILFLNSLFVCDFSVSSVN